MKKKKRNNKNKKITNNKFLLRPNKFHKRTQAYEM